MWIETSRELLNSSNDLLNPQLIGLFVEIGEAVNKELNLTLTLRARKTIAYKHTQYRVYYSLNLHSNNNDDDVYLGQCDNYTNKDYEITDIINNCPTYLKDKYDEIVHNSNTFTTTCKNETTYVMLPYKYGFVIDVNKNISVVGVLTPEQFEKGYSIIKTMLL